MWKTFIATFWLVFLAELGDKTQLATMLMAAHNESVVGVFLGAILALIIASLISVMFGSVISQFIPTNYIHYGAGTTFIIIGILLIIGRY